ncbi:hypothetical protein MUK42_34360 [Musa troglodytarum]|uniref:Uncharacterized protein n=1 Tax=Musa troglodytarum TaxID=320322 RepID=A0A9E7FR34_9LILI|nr:hypothetical protein MUK42_34360 [Musa troglodytarum]
MLLLAFFATNSAAIRSHPRSCPSTCTNCTCFNVCGRSQALDAAPKGGRLITEDDDHAVMDRMVLQLTVFVFTAYCPTYGPTSLSVSPLRLTRACAQRNVGRYFFVACRSFFRHGGESGLLSPFVRVEFDGFLGSHA